MTRTTGGPTALNDPRPIPIPWRVRWLRFRHQLLPVLTLVFCSILAAWLWYNQTAGGHAVGAVEVTQVPVTSGVQGTLAYLPGKQVELFDKVGQGDVVALLDAGPIQSRRAAIQAELDDLQRQEKVGAADRAQTLHILIKAKQQDLAELDLKIDSLQVRSPLSGTVVKVYRRPGQAVQVGEAILEVALDHSTAIVAYLRQEQQTVNPTKGMPVQIYLRRHPAVTVAGEVDSVGGQVESVPNRQLRDQKVPEWGLPVRVKVPPASESGVELKPGEVVTLDFKPTNVRSGQ
jgi:multidrug resistance efflux pump